MADTYTDNYNFIKIEPAKSPWVPDYHSNLDAIDAQMVAMDVRGKQSLWIPAGAMLPTVSNGCSLLEAVELTAGRPDLQVIDFAAGVDQFAQFEFPMPKGWDKGDVTFQAIWTGGALESADVVWTLQGVVVANDGSLDVAYGAQESVVDTFLSAANDLMLGAESAALVLSGTPVDNAVCIFRLGRNGVNASDTYSVAARLKGIKLFINLNKGNEA